MTSRAIDFSREHGGFPVWLGWAEIALILGLFFIHGAWAAPEVNETHYLAKAKHYWDPSWCAGDFFLQTADAHQVFYWTFGWLSRVMSLTAMAWCGRLLSWALLAWSWRRLSWALVPRPLFAVLSAGLFVALSGRCHMAGEWVVGGVEAKGFAYVFVLLALEAVVRDRWNRAWVLLGIASAFHVLIGGWCTVAAATAWLFAGPQTMSLRAMLPGLVGGLVLTLPGLLPAIALTHGLDAALADQAARIYVFERLPHHLLPQKFPPLFIVRHGLLFLVWLALCHVTPVSRDRALKAFVFAAVAIAAVGIVIAFLTRDDEALAAKILRYYWFRTSDAILPLGVALVGTVYVAQSQIVRPRWGAVWTATSMILIGIHLGEIVVRRQDDPAPLADAKTQDLKSWREICAWAGEHTLADALFITPRLAQTFRWYSGRGEVVCRKDIPQDAASIVEWKSRLLEIHRAAGSGDYIQWHGSLNELGPARLRALGRKYGATYVITNAEPPLALERVSPPNPSYSIYRLDNSSEHPAK